MRDIGFSEREDFALGRTITAGIKFYAETVIISEDLVRGDINQKEFAEAHLRRQIERGVLDWLKELAPNELDEYYRDRKRFDLHFFDSRR